MQKKKLAAVSLSLFNYLVYFVPFFWRIKNRVAKHVERNAIEMMPPKPFSTRVSGYQFTILLYRKVFIV